VASFEIPNCSFVMTDETGVIDPDIKTGEIKMEFPDSQNEFDESEEETDLSWRSNEIKLKSRRSKAKQIEDKLTIFQ
jgi:hypothetical protein